jgi:hypothetical protein
MNFFFFSVGMDNGTNATDTAQLAIFFLGIDVN